jgi:hypothetical protein
MDLVLLSLNSPPFVWIDYSNLAGLQTVAVLLHKQHDVDFGARLTRMICVTVKSHDKSHDATSRDL